LEDEEEVLFFPFSLFEIKSIDTKLKEKEENEYEISASNLDSVAWRETKIKNKKEDFKIKGYDERTEYNIKNKIFGIIILFISIIIWYNFLK
jgi:hypothetical protein